jgi:hypothetical protein
MLRDCGYSIGLYEYFNGASILKRRRRNFWQAEYKILKKGVVQLN